MTATRLVAIDDWKHPESDAKNHLGDPAEHKKMKEYGGQILGEGRQCYSSTQGQQHTYQHSQYQVNEGGFYEVSG
jgi:hypothetical protein